MKKYIFLAIYLLLSGCSSIVDLTKEGSSYGVFRENSVGGTLSGYLAATVYIDGERVPEKLWPGNQIIKLVTGNHSVVAQYFGDGSFTSFGSFIINVKSGLTYYFEVEIEEDRVIFILKSDSDNKIISTANGDKVPIKHIFLIF